MAVRIEMSVTDSTEFQFELCTLFIFPDYLFHWTARIINKVSFQNEMITR